MFNLLGQQINNHFRATLVDICNKKELPAGYRVEAEYNLEISDKLKEQIVSYPEPPHGCCINVEWLVNGEIVIDDTGSIDLYCDSQRCYAIFDTSVHLDKGTYDLKVYLPEVIEGDVKYCVYAYNPETDYYTDLIGCYDTYEGARKVASGYESIIEAEIKNLTASGSKEYDLGKVTIGGRKAPPQQPPRKEPIWYPGKFLKKLLGKD